MLEHRFHSGTCSDVTPANGYIIFPPQNQLPNGTYPVGTTADFSCNSGYVWNAFDVECVQPGIWIPRKPQCIPRDECE